MNAQAEARKGPVRRAIDAVLADGQPHTLDELVTAGAAKVPPGRAHREGERQRTSRRGHAVGPRSVGSDEDGRRNGARSVAYRILHRAVRRDTIERLADGTYRARGLA